MEKRKNKSRTAAAVICAAAAVLFISDTIITKAFGHPPVFSIRAVTYDDGISADYYGAGYKIKRDHSILDGSDSYRVTLWLLPDEISL